MCRVGPLARELALPRRWSCVRSPAAGTAAAEPHDAARRAPPASRVAAFTEDGDAAGLGRPAGRRSPAPPRRSPTSGTTVVEDAAAEPDRGPRLLRRDRRRSSRRSSGLGTSTPSASTSSTVAELCGALRRLIPVDGRRTASQVSILLGELERQCADWQQRHPITRSARWRRLPLRLTGGAFTEVDGEPVRPGGRCP